MTMMMKEMLMEMMMELVTMLLETEKVQVRVVMLMPKETTAQGH